jgi:formylmethanofuran dehydrogenase subunit E
VTCDDCGEVIRLDDEWIFDGRHLCGICANEEDPEFIAECEASSE